jgi:DNA polymerase III gamma/tau subunit
VKPILSYLISISIPILTRSDITHIIRNIFEKECLVVDECNLLPITNFLIDTTNSNIKMIINIIEKIKLSKLDNITLEKIQVLSNNISYISLLEYTNHITRHKLNEAIQIIFHLYNLGFSVVDILYEYFQFIKNHIVNIEDKKKYIIISIITKYITLFYETPETNIELAFFTNELINALERYDLASNHM